MYINSYIRQNTCDPITGSVHFSKCFYSIFSSYGKKITRGQELPTNVYIVH